MSDNHSEADGALSRNVAQRFGAAFGTQINPVRERERSERATNRTEGERARASKIQLKLINFKVEPSDELLLIETATRLGTSKTDVLKRGIHLVAEQAKRGK